MKIFSMAALAAAMFGGTLAISASQPVFARMADPGLSVPSATETVACRTVRERIQRPNGSAIWRTRQVCDRALRPRPRCTMERQRIVRPNGAVTFKTVRRCR